MHETFQQNQNHDDGHQFDDHDNRGEHLAVSHDEHQPQGPSNQEPSTNPPNFFVNFFHMVTFLGTQAGLYTFAVTTTNFHYVHICPHTGETWCDCHNFFYKQQPKGQPVITSSNVCKHIREVLLEAQRPLKNTPEER